MFISKNFPCGAQQAAIISEKHLSPRKQCLDLIHDLSIQIHNRNYKTDRIVNHENTK